MKELLQVLLTYVLLPLCTLLFGYLLGMQHCQADELYRRSDALEELDRLLSEPPEAKPAQEWFEGALWTLERMRSHG